MSANLTVINTSNQSKTMLDNSILKKTDEITATFRHPVYDSSQKETAQMKAQTKVADDVKVTNENSSSSLNEADLFCKFFQTTCKMPSEMLLILLNYLSAEDIIEFSKSPDLFELVGKNWEL